MTSTLSPVPTERVLRRRARHSLAATACASLLTLVTACASPAGSTRPRSASGLEQNDGYPRSVTSCGHEVTLARRPERIITIKSSATETVLALGAGDRLVGTAGADGPLPPDLAATSPPVLSPEIPSSEALLAASPDLVYAGWESNLTAKSAGDRDELAKLGVATYVSPAACEEPAYRPAKLGFDDVFAEITEIGGVVGEAGRAETLVAEQKAELATIPADGAARSALWYSSGRTTPYVGAGSGAPQMIMSKIGLRNVAADVDGSWSSFGWEAVAAADPDVIVVVDATWSTAESKIALLRSNPVTAGLPAVRQHRFLRVDFAATQPGVRNVDAAKDLSEQLGALRP